MSETPGISVRDLTKRYRLFGRRSQFQTLKSALLKRDLTPTPESSITALRDVTFDVARGEAFGVIGPNGSGKSTLLKVISGILKPTAGSITVNGRVSALIELGAGFHPEISGRENIFINGIMLGLKRKEIERRFADIVDFAGIGEFLDQPVKTYSSGMYVRLGFSVAVHSQPDVLLIDEVLSVGDEEFSQKCIARLTEMKYSGVTMIFVTHQLELVRLICDRAAWLERGAIAALGDPVRVVDSYLQKVSGKQTETIEEEHVEESDEESVEDGGEERWGSREVILKRVALVDADGRELVALGGRSHVVVEIDTFAVEPQEDCVFGVAIYHANGTCVYGTNTDLEGIQLGPVDGRGRVRFVMPELELVAGNYRIDAAAHTRNGRAFDYRRGVIHFVAGSRYKDSGVYRPDHDWEFDGGVRVVSRSDAGKHVPAELAETLRELRTSDEEDDGGS